MKYHLAAPFYGSFPEQLWLVVCNDGLYCAPTTYVAAAWSSVGLAGERRYLLELAVHRH